MVSIAQEPDNWAIPQRILVVLAHPDDPEFFCGGTIARWTNAGHQVWYCIITCGDKGTKDRAIEGKELCLLRQREQKAAGAILGVENVQFLEYEDGYLLPSLELRRDITRVIREVRPDILVTCDPTTLFVGDSRLNHPDHRATGMAALDAVFPAARDHLYFIDLWKEKGLEPHTVREVWVCGTTQPNTVLDVSETWEQKILAICKHESQISDPNSLIDRLRNRRTEDSTPEKPRYQENFRRLIIG